MDSNSTPAIIFPSNMCRICIEFGKNVQNIEETFVDYEDNLISLLELLNLFSDIELNPSNPNSICSDCLTKATEAYQFKLQCDKSTRILDKMKEALIDDDILEITIHGDLEEKEESTQLEENISKNRVPSQDANKENNNSVEEVRPYSCCFCTETFKYLVAYKDHIQTHKSTLFPEEEEHICMKCGKSLPHSWALRVHEAKCEGIKPNEKAHKCWQCGEEFSKKKALRIHHETECKVKPHVCELCDRQFNKATTLKHHMMRHSNNRSFLCDMCGKGFITDALCREHIRSTHEGKRRKRPASDALKLFLCSFCGLSFSRNCYLELHMQRHTQKGKQLQCEKCGKTFLSGGELRAHYVVHQDEKPFDCKQCGKAFSRKYELKRHEIIHTGSRPHVCRVCNKDFAFARRLKYHLLMVHCKEEVVCAICGMGFTRNYALQKHLIEKHPEGDVSTAVQEDS